jgi:ClpP class serine protease
MLLTPNKIFALAPDYASVEAIQSLAAAPRRAAPQVPDDGALAVFILADLMDMPTSIDLANNILAATDNAAVTHLVVYVDSPGGDAQGTFELHSAIAYAAERKTVTAIVQGLAASAAYWAIAPSTRIIASESSLIGSIGVFSILVDDSEAAARLGIRVIPIATSQEKIESLPGVPVSDAAIAAVEKRVKVVAARFMGAVNRSRKLSSSQVERAFTGEVFYGSEAKQLGLVDEVVPYGFDRAFANLLAKRPAKRKATGSGLGGLSGQAAAAELQRLVLDRAGRDCDWDAAEQAIRAEQPELARAVDEFETRVAS